MSRQFDAMASAKIYSGKPEQTPLNLAMIKFPALCSIKYDGWRMFEYNMEVRCRSMKPPKNRPTQRKMKLLFEAMADHNFRGADGEAITGTLEDAIRTNSPQCGKMFNSYDVNDEFQFLIFDSYQYPRLPFWERLARVEAIVQQLKPEFSWIHHVEHVVVNNMEELMALLDKVEAQGGEGVMGRSFDGPYKMGRSTMKEGWLWALKPYADDEGKIISFAEELENQNEQETDERGYSKRSGHKENLVPKGRLGKFICVSPNFAETFSVGAGIGLTHELRQEVWDNQEKYLGKFIKFKYQAVGTMDRPRQPKFMGFRAEEDMSNGR